MPFGNDPEKPLSSESGDESEVQKNPTTLIARAEKCRSTNLSYLNKAEELKKKVTQKLSEKKKEWHKSPPGAELLRINCIAETCRELLKNIEESIRILKTQKNYFHYLLESENARLGCALSKSGNIKSRNPQNLKDFGKKAASVQINVNYETVLLNEIESAKAEIEKAAKILDVIEERYYCECERSKVEVPLQSDDLVSDTKISYIRLEDSKKKQNQPSNSKHLSASNTSDKTEADTKEKASPTKRSALVRKGIPEKKALLVESAGFKKPSASEVVHQTFKTETVQPLKISLPEDTTEDLANVSKISDIHLEDSTMKQNQPFSFKDLSASSTAEDDTEIDKQEKASPTKRAALVVKEIPEKKALIESPNLNQPGTSKTIHMSNTVQTLKDRSSKAITDKITSSAQTFDCENKCLIYKTTEKSEVDSATKCDENKKLNMKTEASNDKEKLDVPLVSDDSNIDRLAEIDRNVERNQELPEEPEGRNEVLNLEDDIPDIVDDAVIGGRWVREILEHQMNPEPEEELVNLAPINPHFEAEDLMPGNGRWVREILRRESSND